LSPYIILFFPALRKQLVVVAETGSFPF